MVIDFIKDIRWGYSILPELRQLHSTFLPMFSLNTATTSLSGIGLLFSSLTGFSAETVLNEKGPDEKVYQRGYLGKEESLKAIQLQDGYSMKLVLSDPDVKEPVAMAWDGNGVLYVVEMRTYMQDADASGEKKPISRISRHEDVDGDGIYEKHSVFVDNLMLPRFVLPLDDRIMIGVTNTLDLWTYRDSDGDGVADEEVKVYEGGKRGGNMEHQPSGLLWNIDNWLYCTYEPTRYRFTDGKLEVETLPKGQGQWGIGRDNVGRLYYSTAGGETPAISYQQPIVYGALNLENKLQESKDFRNVFPIAEVPDVQGGPRRLGKNGALNQFTGGGGQSIYRGDRLPADLQGDMILPEPVGRLIRRAEVTRKDGYTFLSNYYPEKEFIRSTDVNFRPLWSATSPDGAMMVIDIHRGIIQQGNWTKPGSYLRGIIDKWGLAENIGKGRVYRLEHTTFKPDKKPQMLKESTADLVKHLSHPNGWWRDTAQKLIILREDRDEVVPALEQVVKSGSSDLGRMHALWTLEGISKVTPEIVEVALADSSSIVRTAAIRVSEPFLTQSNRAVSEAILNNSYLKDDIEMKLQLANSVVYSATEDPDLIAFTEELMKSNNSHPVFKEMEKMHEAVAEARAASLALHARDEVFAKAMDQGKITYEQLCFSCHGADGKGAPMPGAAGQFLAPAFAQNPRLAGTDHNAIRTLLHGLVGDLDGKEYEGLMVAMGNNSDEWIADVVTYIRNSFGNEAPQTSPDVVAALREIDKNRSEPWTQKELEDLAPVALDPRGYKLTGSHNSKDLRLAADGDPKTRYTSNAYKEKGMWVQMELSKTAFVEGLKLDYQGSKNDGPDGYMVRLSQDGKSWGDAVASGVAGEGELNLTFAPTEARFIRIGIMDATKKMYWSIHEIEVYGREE